MIAEGEPRRMGREQLDKVVRQALEKRAERLRREQAEQEAKRPENVRIVQEKAVEALETGGVIDLFILMAQTLREIGHPDVRLRVTEPTGDPDDNMAVFLEYDHERRGSVEKFIRIFALQEYKYPTDWTHFRLSSGSMGRSRSSYVSHLEYRGNGENGQTISRREFPYDGGEKVLYQAAYVIVGQIVNRTPEQEVRLYNPRSLRERLLRRPTDLMNDHARPFRNIEIPSIPSDAGVATS